MLQPRDELLYSLVIGGKPSLAAVHKVTASLGDVVLARGLDTTIEAWAKYYRPSLEHEGFVSESDFESKHFAETETLNNFVVANESCRSLSKEVLTLVDTDRFDSRQAACSEISECTGWWRFSQIGYNEDHTQGLLHSDYDHPEFDLMGMGHFVLLELTNDQWTVVGKSMTWIS